MDEAVVAFGGCLAIGCLGVLAFAGFTAFEARLLWLLWGSLIVPNLHWISLEYWQCVLIFVFINIFYGGGVGSASRS